MWVLSEYLQEFQVENVGLTEAEADPSVPESQTLTVETAVDGDAPVTGTGPVYLNGFREQLRLSAGGDDFL